MSDDSQLALPFVAEDGVFALSSALDDSEKSEIDHGAASVDLSWRETVDPSPVPAVERAGTSDRNPARRPAKRKPPKKLGLPPDAKLLVSREEAAEIVSLSIRSIDYLLASKELPFRKIGTRTMIPVSALQSFVRANHPERIAS